MEDTSQSNMLDPRVKLAWRIQSGIAASIVLVAMLSVWLLTTAMGIRVPLLWALTVLVVIGVVSWLTVIPEIRYRRWRWEVTVDEVRLQRGLIVVERTVIPMVRVQHVDTSQGPIMGAFDLSEVRIWTAAGAHSIPALADKDAAQLRDRIATLARVTDDGGL